MAAPYVILQRTKLGFYLVFLLISCSLAFPPKYTESAHGNATYGVNRLTGVSKGNCGHCHEQHKTDSGPYFYLLFDNPVGTKRFCLNCHTEGVVTNRSYSYTAGGYNLDPVNDIEEMFNLASHHNLDSILDFINGKWNFSNQYSSPCVACHDPHYAQRDPKDPSSRGWILRLPSKHRSISGSDRLWGDESNERMSYYVGTRRYQAPYRYGTTGFEPDRSSTSDGSNMVDINTFCLECHISDMNSYGLSHTPIDWSADLGDKHGLYPADGDPSLKAPYSNSNVGDYVLGCTDCHEPHGSQNVLLIRPEINGEALEQVVSDLSGKNMGYICRRCHKDDEDYRGDPSYRNKWEYVHHLNGDYPYTEWRCGSCHGGPPSSNPIPCSNCHYHGSEADGRKTF